MHEMGFEMFVHSPKGPGMTVLNVCKKVLYPNCDLALEGVEISSSGKSRVLLQ